jgi:hypothetical protein
MVIAGVTNTPKLPVLFAVFASLPPDTFMVILELLGAVFARSKVTVMAENPMATANESERVQVRVAKVHDQPGPLIAVAVRPELSAVVTVTVPEEATLPWLLTTRNA